VAVLITADWKQETPPVPGQTVARIGQAGDWFDAASDTIQLARDDIELGKVHSFNAECSRVAIAAWAPEKPVVVPVESTEPMPE